MKIRHHPRISKMRSDPITPEYQAEVDRATSKAMVAYERARRRFAAAIRRQVRADEAVLAAAAKGRKGESRLIHEARVAAELVELRREELQEIERLMKAAPASSTHRGRKGHRPIPAQGSIV